MIDRFELTSLERLHAKLTPGPWRLYSHTGCEGLCYDIFAGDNEFACFDKRLDAEFAIWMYNALPDFISALREAWAKNKELETENSDLKKHCEWLEGNLELKNTNIADLKNQLQALEKKTSGVLNETSSLFDCDPVSYRVFRNA